MVTAAVADGALIGTISVDGGQYDAPEELVQTANSSTKLVQSGGH